MAKHYRIEGNKVIANVAKLTEDEITAIKNYLLLGFTLCEPQKKKNKEAKDAYVAEYVQAWLYENATDEQIEKYWELYNEPVIKDGEVVVYKKDCKSGKEGEPKKKGHINTLPWLNKTFPEYGKTEKEIEEMKKRADKKAAKEKVDQERADMVAQKIAERKETQNS